MRLALAHWVSPQPMGQQMAEAGLIGALSQKHDLELDVHALSLSGLRGHRVASRRLPMDRLQDSAWPIQRALGTWAYRGFDAVHRMDLRLPPALQPEILTVHDVAPLRFLDEGRLPATAAKSARHARVVICPSAFAASEIREAFAVSDVRVIANGLDEAVLRASPLTQDALQRLGLRGRFVLHTGGATARKNLPALAAAWPAVRDAHPDVDLVLCGPTDHRRTQLFQGLAGTRILGKVPRASLVGLMATATVVVVPSLYEGFGLPALEALACGTRVVAADAASLPEITGGHARLVEPDCAGLAEGLSAELEEPRWDAAAPQRWARAHTWGKAATQHASVYREVFA